MVIDEEDVGVEVEGGFGAFFAREGHANHLDIGLHVEHDAEHLGEDGLVIDHHNADGAFSAGRLFSLFRVCFLKILRVAHVTSSSFLDSFCSCLRGTGSPSISPATSAPWVFTTRSTSLPLAVSPGMGRPPSGCGTTCTSSVCTSSVSSSPASGPELRL